jgi:hypothetical protein
LLQKSQTNNNKAMKTLAKIAMIVLITAGAWMLPQKATAQYAGINFQVFYDQLSPYGAWVNDAQYGYVWIPDEGADFSPYATAGHWVFTDYGWTWVSDYPWGWAPFHYGRWNYDPDYGWMWIPGYHWGPAWVSWRRCDDFFGWAPLGPGISIQMSFSHGFYPPEDRWMFVRGRDFDRPDLNRHFVGRREYSGFFHRSTPIKNTRVDYDRRNSYVTGPNENEFRTASGRSIKPIPLKESPQAGRTVVSNNQVQIYRPPVAKVVEAGAKPIPGKVVTKEYIKPVTERSKGDLIRPTPIQNQNAGRGQITPSGNKVPQGNAGTGVKPNNTRVIQNNNGVDQGQTKPPVEKRQLPPQNVNQHNNTRNIQPVVQPKNQQPPDEHQYKGNEPRPINQGQRTPQAQPQHSVPPSNIKSVEQHRPPAPAPTPAKNEKKEVPPHRN